MKTRITGLAAVSSILLLAACDSDNGSGGLGTSFGAFFSGIFASGSVSATADPIDFGGRPTGFAPVSLTTDPVNF